MFSSVVTHSSSLFIIAKCNKGQGQIFSPPSFVNCGIQENHERFAQFSDNILCYFSILDKLTRHCQDLSPVADSCPSLILCYLIIPFSQDNL